MSVLAVFGNGNMTENGLNAQERLGYQLGSD